VRVGRAGRRRWRADTALLVQLAALASLAVSLPVHAGVALAAAGAGRWASARGLAGLLFLLLQARVAHFFRFY